VTDRQETQLDRLKRLEVWIPLLSVGLVLAAVGGAAGAYLGLKHSASHTLEGFLAYGQVSVAVVGIEVYSPQVRRCITRSDQAGTIRQGSPVIISLNGRAVGGGDLSVGQFKRETPKHGDRDLLRASCLYKFSAPVTEPGEGEFIVEIGTAKIPFSMDELRNGINLSLS
jgi:hypothetical protein